MKKNATTATTNPAVNRRVRITLMPDAQMLFNHQPFGDSVSFDATVASTASAMKDGKLVVPADRVKVEEDVCHVTLTVDDLRVVFQAAREFQASRPARVSDAFDAIESAEHDIEFLTANNSGLDLSTVKAKLEGTLEALKNKIRQAGDIEKVGDCREIVTVANEVRIEAKRSALVHVKQRAVELAKQVGVETDLAKLEETLPTDLDAARNAYVAFVKTWRGLRPTRKSVPTTKPAANHGNGTAPLREKIGGGRVGYGSRF